MNRKELLQLAQDAAAGTGYAVHIPQWDKPTWLFIRRFARLVAAAEREEITQTIEVLGKIYYNPFSDVLNDIAKAIKDVKEK